MSTTFFIALIIIVLVALLGFAFITQTISQKRKQKQRLLTALKLRQKDFHYLCNGFPEGFLSKALNLLVHQCLVDVSAQLARLEPGVKAHGEVLQIHSQKLQQVKNQPKTPTDISLDNPARIKEVKALLQGLYAFITNQQQKGHINANQFKLYTAEIRQMTSRLSVDAYLINAAEAEQASKVKLALHFYRLAEKLLAKDGGTGSVRQQTLINTKIAALEKLEASTGGDLKSDGNRDTIPSNQDEWEKFENEEKSERWQKKNVYD